MYGLATYEFHIAGSPEFIRKRHGVHALVAHGDTRDGLEDGPVLLAVKVVGLDLAADRDHGIGVDEEATEHRALGIQVLGRKSFDLGRHSGKTVRSRINGGVPLREHLRPLATVSCAGPRNRGAWGIESPQFTLARTAAVWTDPYVPRVPDKLRTSGIVHSYCRDNVGVKDVG